MFWDYSGRVFLCFGTFSIDFLTFWDVFDGFWMFGDFEGR